MPPITPELSQVDISSNFEFKEAGGDNPMHFDWSEAWYPVFYVRDLDKTKPTPFTLLDRDLVIWWDRQNWQAFSDRCPHRLARLSEGRIAEDGLLECPYHGWAFKGDGQCDRIPQQLPSGTAQNSSRACVEAFATAIEQGLLFVYAGNPENAAKVKVPIITPLEDDPQAWTLIDTFRDLPYDALTLLENVLDPSHLPFTHHRSVGNRANAAPVELELTATNKQGFTGTWAEGPRRGKLGRQDTVFIAPNLMWHDLTSQQLGRTMTVVYATPIRKGMCRLFARFPFQLSAAIPKFFIKISPRWYSHLGQHGILEDDQIFLHYQERYLEALGGSEKYTKAFYLPTKADVFVSALRDWVNQYSEPFPNQALPPALAKEVLLDRYHTHTASCNSCSQALANIRKLKILVVVIAIIAWAATILILEQNSAINSSIIGAIAVIAAGLGWLALSNVESKFYKGQEVPLRNIK